MINMTRGSTQMIHTYQHDQHDEGVILRRLLDFLRGLPGELLLQMAVRQLAVVVAHWGAPSASPPTSTVIPAPR